jgi:uncharacterized protein (TIGR02147 family)
LNNIKNIASNFKFDYITSMSLKGLNSIYSYSDFRRYLKDYFVERSWADSSYSHRAMAKELGFPSPNHIKLVIDGKQRIGLRSLNRLIKGLGLRDREKEYFCCLVFFCQAKTPAQKDEYYNRLCAFRPATGLSAITNREYDYYSEWYHCVVRELVVRTPTPIDYEAIARRVRPSITPAQVKKSVELLLKLGLIKQREDGGFEQTERFIATDREVVSLGIRNYHAAMMDRAKASMDFVNRDDREISALTIHISDACKQRVKKRIQEFEDEVFAMVREDENTAETYQLNLQFFPVSNKEP